jgi:DNA repair photolyase
MLPRPVSNPPNPWLSTEVEYLEEIPRAELEVYEDHTREILSHNDSPDVGFSWSVNPYRGCFHACAYCMAGETPILMGDGTTRPLAEVRSGDVIYGTRLEGRYRHYTRTTVLAHWQTIKSAFRISVEDGSTLIASGDHRFLTERGWTYVTGETNDERRRPHLTPGNSLLGLGGFASTPAMDAGSHRDGDIEGQTLKSASRLRVLRVEPLQVDLPMYDITTGTGDYIANGVVSHNCYARPTHEYLGLGAGTDFDRKITVKPEAPQLLREAFERPSWKGELVVFSGVTDCYQPLEASYRLTRRCLEVCAQYRNPVGLITKSPLIERDIDVLQELQRNARVSVSVSVPIWDRAHAHAIEPFVATPQRRVKTIERLAAAGLSVGVNVAPVIPGLSDADIPRILEAAHAAGARRAGFVFLRLPGSVKQVFEERLRETLPLRADRVLNRVREARGGKLYDARFGVRGRGEGNYAEAARALFDATVKRLGMNEGFQGDTDGDTFRRPGRGRQLALL